MVEVIIAVAILATTVGVSVVSVGKVRDAAVETKMTNDISVLNNAAQAYKTRGGKFTSGETTDSVLSALKTVGSNPLLPGFSGELVDSRLIWKMQSTLEAASDKPRVKWNNSSERFEISFQGEGGISTFMFDESSADDDSPKVVVEEKRVESPFLFAEKSGWIWDYDEETAIKDTSTTEPTKVKLGAGGQTNPIPVSLAIDPTPLFFENALLAPIMTVPDDYLAGDNTGLATIIFKNPNPDGSSEISYSIDYGQWHTYDGNPITVNAGETVIAKTDSTDTSKWANSAAETQLYEAIVAAAEIPAVEVATGPVVLPVVEFPVISTEEPVFETAAGGFIPDPIEVASIGAISGVEAIYDEVVAVEPEVSIDAPVERSAMLSFADEGVDFNGTDHHTFTNIGGTDATMGMSVSASANIVAFESSSVTGSGETGAFFMTSGVGSANGGIVLDLSGNPVSKIDIKILFVDQGEVETHLKVVAQTDNGSTIEMPEIERNEADSSKPKAETCKIRPSGEDMITSVQMKWEQSSHEEDDAYGLGISEISFSFKTKNNDQNQSENSQ